MSPELQEHAVQSRLHASRGPIIVEHGDQHPGRPVPGLARVQVRLIIHQRHRRCDDALFALGVERVEAVDDPVADRAVARDATGRDREVPGVRFVVVALRAVEHERQHRLAGPVGTRRCAARASRLRTAHWRRASRERARAAPRPALAPASTILRAAGAGPRRNASGHSTRASMPSAKRVPRIVTDCAANHAAELASNHDRFNGSFGTSVRSRRPSAVVTDVASGDDARIAEDVRRGDPDQRRPLRRRSTRMRFAKAPHVVERANAGREVADREGLAAESRRSRRRNTRPHDGQRRAAHRGRGRSRNPPRNEGRARRPRAPAPSA